MLIKKGLEVPYPSTVIMKKNSVTPHDDTNLNVFRLLAMSAVGIYLFKVFKKEGSISTATLGKTSNFDVNTDKLVESVMPWVNVSGDKKTIVEAGAKEFLSNVKQSILKK